MQTAPGLSLASRLPASGTTIFSVMSAQALAHGAVNLGQGFPDYPIDPALVDLVTVTTGVTQAIFTSIQALAGPGDEAIVFEPAYDSYVPAIRLAGAAPVTIPLTFPGYRIDWPAGLASRSVVIGSLRGPAGNLPGQARPAARSARGHAAGTTSGRGRLLPRRALRPRERRAPRRSSCSASCGSTGWRRSRCRLSTRTGRTTA